MREAVIHERSSYLRDAVFAASDGLVTTFAVVAGSQGAGLGQTIVVIMGFANLFADGISMSSGTYLGTKSEEEFEHKEGETAYSLLVKKMNETGSSVTTKTYDFGIMVESINGISGNANFFWQYSVNGQMGQVAADNYTLKNKDKVEWKYTSTSN